MLQTKKEIETSKTNVGWAFPFFSLWTCEMLTLLRGQLASFVLIWYLTRTTESAAVLTFAMLVYLLPQIFLGPLAGALIDRWSRKAVLITVDLIIALATCGLASLFLFGGISISFIYVWIFALGLANGFINPAMLATTSLMVPGQHLTRIQGINQTLYGRLSIITAPLGALLYRSLPIHWILALSSSPALIAVIGLFLIEIPRPPGNGQTEKRLLREIQLGLRYIFNQSGLRILLGISVILNCLDAIATH